MKRVKKSVAIVLSLIMVFLLGASTQVEAEIIEGRSQVGKTYKVISEKCDMRGKEFTTDMYINVKAIASGTAIITYTTDYLHSTIMHRDSKTGDYDLEWDEVITLKSVENKDGSYDIKQKVKIKKGEIYEIAAGGFGGCTYKYKLKGKGKVKFEVVSNTGWMYDDYSDGDYMNY